MTQIPPPDALRLGYVIVPILHDADATPDDIFESESFKEVLTTLRALAANDDRIIEYFRAVSQGRQRTGCGSVKFDLDERLAQRIDLAQFVREIDLRCWDRLAKLSWRPFEEARAFARSLQLNSGDEWRAFYRGKMTTKGLFPEDIPAKPHITYAGKGWISMGDWLGTGRVANFLKVYRPFHDARACVRRLKIQSQSRWFKFCKGQLPRLGKLPPDIPKWPNETYANKGWSGYGDWLGTGRVADHLRVYRSFPKARAFARKLRLKNQAEWFSFCRGKLNRSAQLPGDIPANPSATYAGKGWRTWGDWLGTGTIAPRLRKYRPYIKARAFARKLKLKSGRDWQAFCKGKIKGRGRMPEDIPANPNQTYANKGWKSMGDWLGTGRVADHLKVYRPFPKARAFVRRLRLRSNLEWLAYTKGKIPGLGRLPKDIPAYPNQTYGKKGWRGMSDWLGNGRPPLKRRGKP